jgi:hypothetical protein
MRVPERCPGTPLQCTRQDIPVCTCAPVAAMGLQQPVQATSHWSGFAISECFRLELQLVDDQRHAAGDVLARRGVCTDLDEFDGKAHV